MSIHKILRTGFLPLFLVVMFLASCSPAKLEQVDSSTYLRFLESLNTKRSFSKQRSLADLPLLIRALEEPSPTIRGNVARDIRAMGTPAKDAAPALVVCSEDRNADVRSLCRRARQVVLGEDAGASKEEVVSAVAPKTSQPSVITTTTSSQPQILPPPKIVLTPLDTALLSEGSEGALRKAARRHMQNTEPGQLSEWLNAHNYLLGVLQNGEPRNREAAVEVLRLQSAYLDEAIPLLRNALKDEDSAVRARAAFALGESRDSDSVPELSKLLQDQSSKLAASLALRAIGSKAAHKALARNKIPFDKDDIQPPSPRGRPEFSSRMIEDFCRASFLEFSVPADTLPRYVASCVQAAADFY